MDPSIQAAIDKINAQIALLDNQILKKKDMVNGLCELEGEPPLYAEAARSSSATPVSFRADQFYGRPMATVVKEILEQRAVRQLGAISLKELFETMQLGGFEFDNSNDAFAKRNLAIALSKNPAFTKVPNNGNIGLADWYPSAKRPKRDNPPKAPEGEPAGDSTPNGPSETPPEVSPEPTASVA